MDRLRCLPSLKAHKGGGTHRRLTHPHGHDLEINSNDNSSVQVVQMERFSLRAFLIPLQSCLLGWNEVSSVPPPEMLPGPYPTLEGLHAWLLNSPQGRKPP